MSIIECFPMRKRRSVDKTPGRSPCEAPGKLRRTPRRHVNNSHTFHDQSLDIIWDNNSPSPGRTLSLGKRKKHGSDSSSSGGEISDLVQKLADKSGNTPEENPSLLAFWMARDNCAAVQARNTNAVKDNEINKEKHNYKVFQTPSRRPRRVLRKCNKAKIKLLKQEIELLAHRIEEPENEASTDEETVRELISEKIESCSASENTSRIDVDNTNTATKTNQGSENSGTDCVESYSTDFFEGWDNDDEDLILSQVNISNLCNIDEEEPQVMTNTQYLDSGKSPNRNCTVPQPPPPKHHTSSTDVNTSESIVTESWDFVDEFDDNCDESMLQSALEDFERSQSVVIPTVRRLSHLAAPMFQMENKALSGPLTVENSLDKNLCSTGKSKGNQSSMPRHTLSKGLDKANFSFVPHSTLRNATALKSENPQEQQQKDYNSVARNTRMPLKTSIQNNRKTITAVKEEKRIQSKVGEVKDLPKASNESRHKSTEHGHSLTRQVKYSKEDIERKKVEAQHRRRQKMTLSQQKIS